MRQAARKECLNKLAPNNNQYRFYLSKIAHLHRRPRYDHGLTLDSSGNALARTDICSADFST